MAIDTILPVASSTLDPGDPFSFKVDDTYTTLTVEVETSSGYEYAYDSSLGGAQSGYAVSVVASGGRHTFTVTRSAGWNLSPFNIRVVENETGSSATTTTAYTLSTRVDYPRNTQPYSTAGTAQGDHGGLTGLSDDDHPQYHTDARGDLRYTPIAHGVGDGSDHADVATNSARAPLSGAGAPGVSTGNGKNVGHIYVDTTGDQAYTLVDATTDANIWSSGISDHGGLTGLGDDDHSQYHNDARGDARYPRRLDGAGAPGVSTGNGLALGTVYADTTNDVGYILVDATTDTNVWWTAAGGGGGSFGYGNWNYDAGSTTGAGTATGEYRLNNADPTSATELYISKTNAEGVNLGDSLDEVDGWKLAFWNADGTEGFIALCGTVTDNSTYFTIAISAVAGDTSLNDNDNFGVTIAPSKTETSYPLVAGTRAQDAVFLTERPDHVNTPVPTTGEDWVKSGADQERMFTDDQARDFDLRNINRIQVNGYCQANETNWKTWNGAYGWTNELWSTNAGATTGDPTTNNLTVSGIHMMRAGTLLKCRVVYYSDVTEDIEFELWSAPITDGMTANATDTLLASGTDAATATDKHIIDLTIASDTIAENDNIYFFVRRVTGTGTANLRVLAVFEILEHD